MPHSAASSLGRAYRLEPGVKGALRRAAKGAPPALDPGFKPVMPVAPIRNSKEAGKGFVDQIIVGSATDHSVIAPSRVSGAQPMPPLSRLEGISTVKTPRHCATPAISLGQRRMRTTRSVNARGVDQRSFFHGCFPSRVRAGRRGTQHR